MLRTLLIALLGLMFASLVASCAQGVMASGTSAEAAADTRVIEEYRLGVADKVRVTVFGEAALTGEFLVGGNGRISLPLIGETQASGLTIGQFQQEVATALQDGFITNPRVSAEVLNYRPFYILGEVNTPGEYPYTNSLTVLNAVATAGGFTYRADNRRVYIKRADGDAEEEFPLTTSTRVAPGDTIRIRERLF
ncbi:polysaccharide biosynthesis/export family protein [Brevundimonas sp.]|uniref:polysaccharide biosynthesis/export family protein n=1 Tax=Brevundimonas sp. TaxID=1871086 RepID=UPI00286AC640|nr:polysaccharide biosynthesis/export family protein [Brevundimonas sp.]